MVATRRNGEGDGPDFEAMINAALANALPNLSTELRTQIYNDIRNGAAEDWITHMEKLFQVLGCPDNFKTRLAAFKLEGDALSWWTAHLRTQAGGEAYADTCTWATFREIFYNRYFPVSEQQRFEREYGYICQQERENLVEYMQRFMRLEREVSIEEEPNKMDVGNCVKEQASINKSNVSLNSVCSSDMNQMDKNVANRGNRGDAISAIKSFVDIVGTDNMDRKLEYQMDKNIANRGNRGDAISAIKSFVDIVGTDNMDRKLEYIASKENRSAKPVKPNFNTPFRSRRILKATEHISSR
ncbi:zinc finger, CCHC-type, Retrotransposon gag domain protein [Artemisia annua]|uniref:Zinc finger, CCHC-type, Retrotransposon gag domain protein n=1 Tax=Artemisia annua TaxID=35608 RepID=A0A2U1N5X0_ARTAN|nr:zinc finger, CCHC-type, Retrotransposon gag domain protein [Artemisia annua]